VSKKKRQCNFCKRIEGEVKDYALKFSSCDEMRVLRLCKLCAAELVKQVSAGQCQEERTCENCKRYGDTCTHQEMPVRQTCDSWLPRCVVKPENI
jgi:hypothetical protein